MPLYWDSSNWGDGLVCFDTPGHLARPCSSRACPSSSHQRLLIPSGSLCPLLESPFCCLMGSQLPGVWSHLLSM